MRFNVGRATDDPEKMVTPGIMYCSMSKDGVSVHMLAAGWWDWSVSVMWHRRAKDQGQ